MDRSSCISTFMMHDRDGFFSLELNRCTEIKHSFSTQTYLLHLQLYVSTKWI